MKLQTLLEANVEPKGLDLLDKWIHEMGEDLEDSNPSINHTAFLKRLRKDIINNKPIMYPEVSTPLKPYKPKKTDPDFIKNASDVYTVNKDVLDSFYNNMLDLFIPDDGEPTSNPLFYKFHNLVKDAKTLDPHIANKLLPIKKKYEQGKFDLPGLEDAMKVMTQLGAQKWKHDPAEKRRLEAEAPIIMKFKNGSKWVRLDSQEEMKREGDMMQNCISGYCPIGEQGDLTLGLRDTFNAEVEPADQTDDSAYEWLLEWLEENDTDVQDFIANKINDGLDPQLSDALEDILGYEEEHAFEWMVDQIRDADDDDDEELTDGHLVYSLRDKHGESHISAEYDPNVDMSNIEPDSALGKQNKPPVEKYGPYIEKLNDFFTQHPETFGPAGNTKDMPFHPDYDDDREHTESIIDRMKPSVRQAILEAKTNGYLYHATFTKNVPNILNKGLLQFQPSLWIKGPGGSRYNEQAGIFAFDNPKDALNWGGKMEWEFRDDDKDISIVRIDMEEFWGDDPAEDPFIAQHGKSMRSAQNIKADKIIDSVRLEDLGKPGELGISRDDWLEQSSKVLGESFIVEAKEKLTLAKLPYAKNALAPVMSKKTLDYHYSGLAKAYVDKFNSGEGDAKFNEAGAFLHNIFFPQLQASTSGNNPTGASLDLINNKYGSFDKFKEEFTNTAMGIQGSGWIYMTKSGTIKIIKNHAIKTDIAMLVDWWEHAWVLDYGKDKGKYCANFWRIINWDVVNEKLGQPLAEGKSPHKKGTEKYKKHMAAMHANMEDVEYDHKENTYPEIEFVCTNDEYCNSTDPDAQNALWNDLRSVKGIVSYKQDWSHDDPVGNTVSMAVIIKDSEALDIIRALADKHGVEIDLDSIEHRSEKYLDTLASGETPYVVDVMFHEENNMRIKDIKETIHGNYKGMGYKKNKNDKFALIDHTFEKVILTTNDFEEARKEAVEWAEYDDISVSVIEQSKGNYVVFELDSAADAEQWRSDNDEWDEIGEDVNKRLRDVGQQMLNRADQNTEQGPDKAEPSAETNFNKSMGKTITTGKIDSNLEQSGKAFADDLRSRLNRIKKVGEEAAGVGKVVKGVNTTADVGPDQINKNIKALGL